MNPWEWFTTTADVDSLLTSLGVGVLAILFARDQILTKAQHLRRVEDLVKHHTALDVEKDSRIEDMRASRDAWREAARIERERADRATEGFKEFAASMNRVLHVLDSLDRALVTTPGRES
jgi:hypothetical protein